MAIELTIPKLGLTMQEANLAKWTAQAGDRVRKDQIVLVIETDKVTYEMPSPAEGLLWPVVAPDTRVPVGAVVGYLAANEAELAEVKKTKPAAAGVVPAAAPAAPVAPRPAGRIFSSPLARAMAKEHGLDLGAIPGTGPGGRIVKADVEKALAAPRPAPAVAAPAPVPAVPAELLTVVEEIPIKGVRRVIFQNMHQSLQTQAQLTITTECSAKALIQVRNSLNESLKAEGVKISFNAILVKAIAQAVKRHPRINASVAGEVIRVFKQVHVGVAMDLGEGLIVPKVRSAETKSILEISRELDDLIAKAKAKTILPDDLSLGTFTLTNLGAWDIDAFTPIVNAPESAILGAGRIVDKPWVRDGQVVVEPRMALSLSFDHRIIDGAPGAAFLKTLKEMLEQPLLML